MRIVGIGLRNYTQVECLDEPGAGGACHKYQVSLVDKDPSECIPVAIVNFQNGPIKENGVNGCHQEDLIAICIDRLQCFQKGEYACRENAVALTKLEEGLMWLRKRTQDRLDRGVEGTRHK